ncbi:hypothetical protein QZH41_000976 [Actinostola sp. cb2023]|nr:hypothetical protein QZH41_000976 [Actinostola sp. cb2023]
MDGLETCSKLATSLSSSSLAVNPPSEQLFLREDAESASSYSIQYDNDTQLKTVQDQSMNEARPPLTKVFDFAAGDEEEDVNVDPKQDPLHIDVDAEFAKVFNLNEHLTTGRNTSRDDATKIVSFDYTSGDSVKEDSLGKKKKISKQSKMKNQIMRSKSENSSKGIKLLKIKFFSRKMKNKLVRNKTEEVIPSEVPAWDDFGVGQPADPCHEGSLANGTSDECVKDSVSKEEFSIDSDINDVPSGHRDINGWSSTEALENDLDKPSQSTNSQQSSCEKEKFISQLEKEKTALMEEKMDLMNALSNIWIEMEDLKNLYEEERENTKSHLFEGFPQGSETSSVKRSERFVENDNNGMPGHLSETEQSGNEHLKSKIKELSNSNEGLLFEKNIQNDTIKSLRSKLNIMTKDKENLSRKINDLFAENKALKESIHNPNNNKETPKVSKLKEENFSLKSRLDNLLNAKLLLEKSQQKLQLERKKMKGWQLQVEERCETLTQNIDKELKTTDKKDVSPASNDTNKTEGHVLGRGTSDKYEKRRLSDNVLECFEYLSDSDSYHSENSVQQMVKNIERSKSTDSELTDEFGCCQDAEKSPLTNIRRSVTMTSINNHKPVMSLDDKGKDIKVLSRFPPTHTSSTDKSRREMKSPKSDEMGFRPIRKKNPSQSELEQVSSLEFLSNLETRSSKLLEKYKESNKTQSENLPTEYEMKTGNGGLSPRSSIDGVGRNEGGTQSDTVLYSCLRNLQKENDTLKLDNLTLKAMVTDMQSKKSENASVRTEDDSVKPRKGLIEQVAEKDWCFETRDEPELDVALFDNFIDERLSKGNGFKTKTEHKTFDEIDGIKVERNRLESDIELSREPEKDISSWHRKHSEKKSRENAAKVYRKKETESKNDQDDLAQFFSDFDDAHTNQEENETSLETLSRARALSLDGGINEVEQQSPRLLTRSEEYDFTSQSQISNTRKDGEATPQAISEDKTSSVTLNKCCKSYTMNDHHLHCSPILARLGNLKMEIEKAGPGKRGVDNKTIRKAFSTYGSRERLYKVHYV